MLSFCKHKHFQTNMLTVLGMQNRLICYHWRRSLESIWLFVSRPRLRRRHWFLFSRRFEATTFSSRTTSLEFANRQSDRCVNWQTYADKRHLHARAMRCVANYSQKQFAQLLLTNRPTLYEAQLSELCSQELPYGEWLRIISRIVRLVLIPRRLEATTSLQLSGS